MSAKILNTIRPKGTTMKILSIALAMITMTAAATASLAATNSKSEKMAAKSPESLECSKQADAKGLHGKERKKFREECKKDLKTKASTTSPSSEPASKGTKTETPPPKPN